MKNFYTSTTNSLGKNSIPKTTSSVARLFSVAVCTWLLLTACSNTTQRFALATAHPLATKAGASILEQGGNAFDAAITISAVLAVVEPYSSGFGGGGFWLLHRQADKHQTMLDGRERAPSAAYRKMYLDPITDEPLPDKSLQGPLAAAIPGMPAALVHLAQNYASLPLTVTLRPAIQYAREGFPADARLISYLEKRKEKLSPSTREIFLNNGQLPRAGQRIFQKELADTIEQLSTKGFDGFYRGQVAENLVTQVKAHGGVWRMQDLANYRVVERKPIRFSYQGATITSAALPSAGGIVLAEIFNTLSAHPQPFSDQTQFTHYLIESMRLAYRDRAKWLGDSDFVYVPEKKLLSKEYATAQSKKIDLNKANADDLPGETQKTAGQNTTHFSIIDAQGNRVAATLSINYLFGSGFTARGSGVLLNNEMDDFVIKAGTPNIYGLVGSQANMIEPNKRMLSSMSPTFIETEERLAVLGTPGGSRIITMVLLGILDFLKGENAHAIVSAKRFHHQYLPNVIEYEEGAFDKKMHQKLLHLGHFMKAHPSSYGNMQLVLWNRKKEKFDAASDPRGIGTAYIHE